MEKISLNYPFYPFLSGSLICIRFRQALYKGDYLRHSSDVVKRVVSGNLDLIRLKILQY